MFFNSEPEKFFPCAQIDVVQFPEGDDGDNIIEHTFTGPLHEQLRAALRYIRNTVITERVVKHSDRAEADRFFNYPYAAIEEALSNAVYHKLWKAFHNDYYQKLKKTLRHESRVKVNFETGDPAAMHYQFRERKMIWRDVIDYIAVHDARGQASERMYKKNETW